MTDQTIPDVQFGRPFLLVRDTDVSGVSGTGIVANGIQWPDGHAAIHWTGSQYPTTTPHPGGMESVTAVHGHGGATRVVWEPSAIPQAEYSSVWPELVGWVQAAHEDGEQIDPAQLLEYLRELKGRALAPVREWMAGIRDAARQATGQPDTEAAASPVCECQPVRLHDDYREAAVYLHEATCPTVGQPAAPEAHPADITFAIEKRGDTDWLMASSHYDEADREKALSRLARRREQYPDTEFRLVRETTTWTVEDQS